MGLISYAFIFVGSICFALGYLHLIIFLRRRDLKIDLILSLMAFSISLSTFFEIWAFKTVLIGAIVVFFLIPFLPKVPFFVGHIIEINGVFGVVSAIDVFRVTMQPV